MIIHLNADWRIASDPLQWILQHRRETEKGREQDVWINVGYFHTLDEATIQAATRQVRLMPGTYGPDALEPLCTALDRLREEVRTALAGFEGRVKP